jgi:hypothetical protein
MLKGEQWQSEARYWTGRGRAADLAGHSPGNEAERATQGPYLLVLYRFDLYKLPVLISVHTKLKARSIKHFIPPMRVL